MFSKIFLIYQIIIIILSFLFIFYRVCFVVFENIGIKIYVRAILYGRFAPGGEAPIETILHYIIDIIIR
jgi:hypothetical protein